MQIQIRTLALALIGLVVGVACGQKGPLYLPGDTSAVSTEIPAQPASQSQNQDDEEDEDASPDADR